MVDFGFAEVAPGEKRRRVDEVFARVAPYYDRMNDAMSLGAHRWWKRAAVWLTGARPGMRALDLAAGTGDLTVRLARAVAPGGRVVAADLSAAMLAVAAERLRAHSNALPVQCDAEKLPFPDRRFDRVVIGFGLRNVVGREQALAEMHRVLRVGGRAFILEFSPPSGQSFSARARRAYLEKGLPRVGKAVAGDAASYRYLGESILRFPPAAALAGMMRAAGFAQADWLSFAGGAVCLHRGRRDF